MMNDLGESMRLSMILKRRNTFAIYRVFLLAFEMLLAALFINDQCVDERYKNQEEGDKELKSVGQTLSLPPRYLTEPGQPESLVRLKKIVPSETPRFKWIGVGGSGRSAQRCLTGLYFQPRARGKPLLRTSN